MGPLEDRRLASHGRRLQRGHPASGRGPLQGPEGGGNQNGWVDGDWVGAPADRRLAFHDHSLRGATRRAGGRLFMAAGFGVATRLFSKTAAVPAQGWISRGWAVALPSPPRLPGARGGGACINDQVGARLLWKLRGRGWAAGTLPSPRRDRPRAGGRRGAAVPARLLGARAASTSPAASGLGAGLRAAPRAACGFAWRESCDPHPLPSLSDQLSRE